MKTTFKDIVNASIDREGGRVKDPDDRGGATNMGITVGCLKTHGIDVNGDGLININDVWALPYNKAVQIYRQEYWQPSRTAEMPGYLRELYFDMVINHGQGNAVRIIQHAIAHKAIEITIDGRIGPQTLAKSPYLEVKDVVLQRLLFYTDIQLNHPSQRKFARGWYHHRCINFIN